MTSTLELCGAVNKDGLRVQVDTARPLKGTHTRQMGSLVVGWYGSEMEE